MSSKTAQAYRRIKHLIEEGHLSGGERLTEVRAAEMIGMGRGPVRQSLLLLEAEGLLEHKGLRRSRVVAYVEDQDPEEMLHRYELRESIEGSAARLAAKNMTGWQIDRLRELNQEIEDARLADDWEAREEAADKFHHFLVADCGNPLLLQVWQTHRLAPLRPRSRKLDDRIIAEAARDNPEDTGYGCAVEAIAAHDPDRAEDLLRQRVRAVTEVIRRMVMEQAEGGRPGRIPLTED